MKRRATVTRGYDIEAMKITPRLPARWRIMVASFLIGLAVPIVIWWALWRAVGRIAGSGFTARLVLSADQSRAARLSHAPGAAALSGGRSRLWAAARAPSRQARREAS